MLYSLQRALIAVEGASVAADLICADRQNLSQTLQRIALWLCAVGDAQLTVFNICLCFHNGSSTNELYYC